jgi:hypothetical protein
MQPNKDYPFAINYIVEDVLIELRANTDDFLEYSDIENIVADSDSLESTINFLLADIQAIEVEVIVSINSDGKTIRSAYGQKTFPLAPRPTQIVATASLGQ